MKMTNLDDQLEKVKIDEDAKVEADETKRKKIILNELNDGIPDELSEDARRFEKSFQDLELRERTRYRITNYSSNLFSKNVETSQKYRKLGNELYAEQRYEEALDAYNQVSNLMMRNILLL